MHNDTYSFIYFEGYAIIASNMRNKDIEDWNDEDFDLINAWHAYLTSDGLDGYYLYNHAASSLIFMGERLPIFLRGKGMYRLTRKESF